MKKLIYLFLSLVLSSNLTQTYANPVPVSPGLDGLLNNTKLAMEQVFTDAKNIKGIFVTENDLIPRILSKLFLEIGWTPNPVNGCAVRVPKSFNPNPSYDQLLEIEAMGISKIDVKIYNNWGVQVAESSLINKTGRYASSKKLGMTQNEIKFNQEMKEGTYYYELDICCFNGEKTVKEGEIRLMKNQKK